jgi:hypothetical protein
MVGKVTFDETSGQKRLGDSEAGKHGLADDNVGSDGQQQRRRIPGTASMRYLRAQPVQFDVRCFPASASPVWRNKPTYKMQ